jgi:hypothetical protein
LFAAPRASREWRFAPTQVLVFRGRRRVYAYGALLNVAVAALAGLMLLALSTTGGTATMSATAVANVLSSLPVHNVPSSIPHASTCDQSLPDVSVALQMWINTVPNYSIARLGANQCYHTEYPLLIGAKTLVMFDGNNSTLASFTDGCDGTRIGPQHFVNCRYPSPVDALGRTQSDWPANRDHLDLLGNVKLIVANLHIEGGMSVPGYNPDYAFQHGILIEGRNDGDMITNVTVDHVWGDFVNFRSHYSSNTKQTTHPENVTIENSHFGLDQPNMGSGRIGFTIDDGANLHIQNNVIQYSSRSAVDIEPVSSNSLLQEIHIEHNTFGPHSLNLFANHWYGHANPVISGFYFNYNKLVGTGLGVDSIAPDLSNINENDPSTFHRHNYQFVGNVADTVVATGSCPGPNEAMRLYGIDGLLVRDNVAPVASGRCMTLVDIALVHNSRILNNTTQSAIRESKQYYHAADYCERNNMVNNPLTLDTSALAPTCTN